MTIPSRQVQRADARRARKPGDPGTHELVELDGDHVAIVPRGANRRPVAVRKDAGGDEPWQIPADILEALGLADDDELAAVRGVLGITDAGTDEGAEGEALEEPDANAGDAAEETPAPGRRPTRKGVTMLSPTCEVIAGTLRVPTEKAETGEGWEPTVGAVGEVLRLEKGVRDPGALALICSPDAGLPLSVALEKWSAPQYASWTTGLALLLAPAGGRAAVLKAIQSSPPSLAAEFEEPSHGHGGSFGPGAGSRANNSSSNVKHPAPLAPRAKGESAGDYNRRYRAWTEQHFGGGA